ncbi:formate-tetrahydrofolate ligase [Enterococcus sp. 12C11_DIV0727]|uniref:formate--tetrahydrofolate ligase n=1 Tax=Candidatus Enterococcus lemimoniae TaxID=1834167 RepID=A0ABZ2T932_9ENTE|nr:hypothetical protein A5866_002517 [Enterococcus sp. 12C11_DIV0727]
MIATNTARKLAEYVVTEGGFGADLGAEKFIDIKCRKSGIRPSAVVVVATVRALKMHGGIPKDQLGVENVSALKEGLPNLLKHIENTTTVFGLPTVVAINKFPTDTEAELKLVEEECQKRNVNVVLSDVWAHGGAGGEELAREVIRLADQESNFSFAYPDELPIKEKISAIVEKVYGGTAVRYEPIAEREIAKLEKLGFGNLPICMAKTQYSFSDDQTKLGRPTDFTITISNIKISAGAGFIVAYTGSVMTMPGLPKKAAYEKIDVDSDGKITGLF